MFKPQAAFSGFSVDDVATAKAFYTEKLGLKTKEEMGGLHISLPGGGTAWAYAKPDHTAASYTMLNFVVENIEAAASALAEKGVTFERYEGMHQDDAGIARGRAHHMGPDIAWFKDPAGNILAVLQKD